MFFERNIDKDGVELNFRQKIVVIIMDVALLIGLSYSIYVGNREPASFVPVFLKTYIPIIIGILITSKLLIRRLKME